MNRAYFVLKWTAQRVANGAATGAEVAKDYTLSWISPLVNKVQNNELIKRYLSKIKTKSSNNVTIFTYIRWSKDIAYVAIILFCTYYLVKTLRYYNKWRQDREQRYIEELIRKRQLEKDQEDDLKFRLLKNILEHDFEYKDPRLRSRHEKMYLNGFESDQDETTNHWSCKINEDECVHWHNGNISEISYWNDVSDKPPANTHSHKKMLEYLGTFIHNSKECDQMKAVNEKKYLTKKFKKFQAEFSKYRNEFIVKTWQNNYDFAGQNDNMCLKEDSKECLNDSHKLGKVWSIAKSQNENIRNVNFFEILSQLGEQYTSDNEKTKRLNKHH